MADTQNEAGSDFAETLPPDWTGWMQPATAAPSNDSTNKLFPLVLGCLLVFGIVLAKLPTLKHASATPAAAEPAAPAVDVSAEMKKVQESLAALSTSLDDVKHRLDALPKAALPSDLEPLQSKIAEVAKATAPLSRKVADLDKALGGFRGDVASLRDDVKKVATLAAAPKPVEVVKAEEPKPEVVKPTESPKPVETVKVDNPTVSDEALSKAVDLYKASSFRDANTAFHKLTETYPNDARVWYYAALSNGLATNEWQAGETIRLVNKGVEREKAGSPAPTKIDAAFADLIPTSKAWLDYYRKTAAR